MPAARPRGRQYLTAREAAALLGVSRSSLYSYVSRGRIRAEADPRNPRVSRYLASDVERLRDRKEARREPDVAVRKTLQWGLPVLESTLTLIEGGRLYYRGHEVTALARRQTFEAVVRILWNADRATPFQLPSSIACAHALARVSGLPAIQRMQAILPALAADDRTAFDVRPEAVVTTGWKILHALTAAATGQPVPATPIAGALSAGWRAEGRDACRLIDMALILCADHELNVSAFASRVVASARTSPYDVVLAGLSALRGPLHGGHTSRVEALLDECAAAADAQQVIASRTQAGARLPGFGHPLYPHGDPRAKLLLAAIERASPGSPAIALARVCRRAGSALLGEAPTIDFALVILRRALALPDDAALVLFAIGRTAGWIAHAMEQYASNQLIRPRAQYVGPQR